MENKYGVGTVIDIKAMYNSEKKKREMNKKVLAVKREAVFNLLQDMRHILILDMRTKDEFSKSRIRGSYWFDTTTEDETERFKEFLKYCKQSQEKLLSQDDDHRRLLIVTAEPNGDIDILKPILETTQAFHKVMQLKDGYDDFELKYPFLCISDDSSGDDIKRAEARFPSEIIPNKLFFGNFINSLNKEHFKKLNITSIFQLKANKAEKVEVEGEGEYEDRKTDKYIDFVLEDETNKNTTSTTTTAVQEVTEGEGEGDQIETTPTSTETEAGAMLLYSFNGYAGAVVIIRILMMLKKWPREIATATVFSKRPDVKDIPASMFMQIDSEKVEEIAQGIIDKYINS